MDGGDVVKRAIAVGLWIGVAASAACKSTGVRVTVDPTADFAVYETYSWVPTQFIREIRQTVNAELGARGLEMRASGGDLLWMDIMTTEYKAGEDNIAIYARTVATVTLVAFDTVRGDTVWAASTTTNLNDPSSASGQLEGAVRRLMDRYPR